MSTPRLVVALAVSGALALSCARGSEVEVDAADVETDAADLDAAEEVDADVDAAIDAAIDADPCSGVTCTAPPANYCTTANDLRVFETPGTCSDGDCAYGDHTEFCAFGCVAGSCTGDPCVGVTCNAPPAPVCVGANTRRTYAAAGTCSGGTCTYAPVDENCLYGCAAGACLECQVTANCPGGEWCNGGTCVTCNTDGHCGTSCASCTAAGDHCNAGGTACVDCVVDGHCAAANYCNGGACAACNVAAHCGPSCATCSGTTPTCNGTACVCTAASCGSYNQCVSGGCVECNTAAACGASCTACGGATPYCADLGSTSQCVECLLDTHCPTGETCQGGVCNAGCNAPTAACASGGNQDGACSNAYTITRAAAGTTAGFHVNDTYGMCGRANDFAHVASCESGGSSNGSDAAYRLFMKAGESAQVTLLRGSSTCSIGWNGTISLKIYGTACSTNCASCPQTCATLHHCQQANSQNTNFVAPTSGWYVFVVDTRGNAGEDIGGVFDLVVKLTCASGTCTCP
jgi:Cys-rich repeat protein